MNLYVLELITNTGSQYDKAYGFVVRAKNQKQARILASDQSGDEGSHAWLDSKITSCKKLKKSGMSEVVLRDFNAGQ